MTGDKSHYEVVIDLDNPNTSHSQVVHLVGPAKRVLDVGCWTGDLGRALTGQGCTVSGVEIDPEAADKARDHLHDVVVADLDTAPITSLFPAGSFDVLVFADVLEHLRDPVRVLQDALDVLAPGGRVVISLPNVTHGSVRLALLAGHWNYTETGLLDATHIRFFSRSGVVDLVRDSGLVLDELRGTVADPLGVEVEVVPDNLPPTVVEWTRHQPDAMVYQFVVAAHVAAGRDESEQQAVVVRPAVPEETVRLNDVHTERMVADVEARQRVLNIRDHIVGLEAAAATAQYRAEIAEHKLNGTAKRLERKNEKIQKQTGEITSLRRRLADLSADEGSGRSRRLRPKRDHGA